MAAPRSEINEPVQLASGPVVPGATALLYYRNADGSAGALAPWYAAPTGGSSSTAAIVADARGRLIAWVEDGAYLLVVSDPRGSYTLPIDPIPAVNVPNTVLVGSVAYDPPSLTNGANAVTTVTVTGALVGDFVQVSLDTIGVNQFLLQGQVSAADTVTVILRNLSGGTIDLAAGTLRARVSR